MAHISEEEFQCRLEEFFRDEYRGMAVSIERQKWLSGISGYADFWIELPEVTLAVEVENDTGSIRPGCAQAMEYASADSDAVPVLCVPEGHTESKVVEIFRGRGVLIKEFKL